MFSNEHGEWKDWLMERSCILWGTVDQYIGGHLGISVYQPLCWLMRGQLSTNWIDQCEDRVQSFKHRVSTYFWAVLWVRVGFHRNFQVKFICLYFFALFSALHNWIVLILSWLERSFSPEQVRWQCSPWPLKLMISQGVQGV